VKVHGSVYRIVLSGKSVSAGATFVNTCSRIPAYRKTVALIATKDVSSARPVRVARSVSVNSAARIKNGSVIAFSLISNPLNSHRQVIANHLYSYRSRKRKYEKSPA